MPVHCVISRSPGQDTNRTRVATTVFTPGMSTWCDRQSHVITFGYGDSSSCTWQWSRATLHVALQRVATKKPSLQHDTNREIQKVCVRMTEYVRFSRGTPFQVTYSFSTIGCWLHMYNHHKNSRKTWTKIFTHYNNSNAFIFFYLFIYPDRKNCLNLASNGYNNTLNWAVMEVTVTTL
jgi:hypothetical protein